MKTKILAAVAIVALAAGSAVGQTQDPMNLNAAGATFPYPIYSKWFNEYHKLNPNIQINYQSIGSGGGIQQLKAGTVDFGASDMPLKDDLLAQFNFKILQFPTVLGAVMPTYNIPGVSAELKFTPQALADIYLGKVTKWNDSEITSSNPGVNLPGNDIVVVHRSDGSGTTFVWTDYLSKVSSEWKDRVGSNTSVNWPVGLGGKGNEGVSGVVQQTPNSIGYVELIYAIQNHLPYGMVQNSSGKFIMASLATVTAAASGAAAMMKNDIRVSITNASGADAYPICSFTYLLIPVNISDSAKRQTITNFLHWMLTSGQGMVEALDYARLPKAVVAIEERQISQIK
ncbi:MAG TPA: phosphate ABC transporter substrate-binding protein PstS [Candidatus Acidoferrales bacterium]|nr:phosphate ABC transporter substrate-binding protein PstS [Candidatus Acidoferrales bacterium]